MQGAYRWDNLTSPMADEVKMQYSFTRTREEMESKKAKCLWI
jgi:hypothetical protein